MSLWGITFDRPVYLWLLLLLPVLWWWSFRSLSGLGSWRRWMALGLRSLVLVLLTLALAEIQWVQRSDRVAVIYLVDNSLSIGRDKLPAMVEYLQRDTAEHLDQQREDYAGVIVFGSDAAVESPPYPAPLTLVSRFEAPIDPQRTNLAGALKMAMAMFPEHAAKRIVILTDGNENVASAREQAQSVVDAGIGIDVVPLRSTPRGDVLVQKVTVPTEIRSGLAFDVSVVLQGVPGPNTPAEGTRGKLTVLRRGAGGETLLAEQEVVIPSGKHVIQFRDELTTPDFYTYSARFAAADVQDNAVIQNDQASGFTRVAGRAQVLLIVDSDRPDEFKHLAERLAHEKIDVTLQPSNQLFTNLADLQRYDTIVLGNVARSGGDDADNLRSFSDEQIEMLVRNTEELGAGLVMLGGNESFGAGGWTGTRLEEAMPVDFQVKNSKVMAVGALALVIDKSGSMQGEKIQMCRAAAIAAAKQLGRQDYLGVVAFDDGPRWTVKMEKATSVDRITKRIQRLDASGGTDMFPAMREAHNALKGVNASVKHMIVLTDGQTAPGDFRGLVQRMKKDNITVTSVAIGTDAARNLLTEISNIGGGKYYQVTKPKAIPSIFMREARRVARPLIVEEAAGITTQIQFPHEVLTGIEQLPPVTGFVLTTPKDNPLVEVAAVTERDQAPPLLATWTFGQGRTAVWTTDAGQRWAGSYTQWPNYDRLFTQLVRWSLRPSTGDRDFTLHTQVQNDRVQVIVQSTETSDEPINEQTFRGVAVDEGGQPLPLKLVQIAPGRFSGEFVAPASGNYFVAIQPGQGQGLLRAGVNVAYSAEFQARETNELLLKSLAAMKPRGGQPGVMLELPQSGDELPAAANPFRRDLPPAISSQAAWHLALIVLGLTFFFDVLNRRVTFDTSWVSPLVARFQAWRTPKTDSEAASPALARLKSKKVEVSAEQQERLAATRFAPQAPEAKASSPPPPLAEIVPPAPTSQAAPTIAPETRAGDDDYTARLLKAKREAKPQ